MDICHMARTCFKGCVLNLENLKNPRNLNNFEPQLGHGIPYTCPPWLFIVRVTGSKVDGPKQETSYQNS